MFDPLQLRKQDFSNTDLIVFSGISGSGKTTALSLVRKEHALFHENSCYTIQGSPIVWNTIPHFQNSHLFIDEIHTLQDLIHCIRLLKHGNRIILASHLASPFFLPLKACYRVRTFRTDSSDTLLREILEQEKMTYTERALQLYCSQYGYSLTALQLMKDEVKSNNLDEIIHVFRKYHALTFTRTVRPTQVTPYVSPART